MSKIKQYLSKEVEKGTFPGFSYLIATKDNIVEYDCGGYQSLIPEKRNAIINGIYDLASLTKPLVIASIFVILKDKGIINFEDKISKYFPQFYHNEKKNITILQLLTHTSGLKGWFPLYLKANNLTEAINLISTLPLDYSPGSKVQYSCVGYILLTAVLKKITGKNIDSLFEEFIASKLNLSSTFFNPNTTLKELIAPTEYGNNYEKKLALQFYKNFFKERNYLIWGEPHDSNCYFLGGLTGNSGLFSNIFDLYEIAKIFIQPSPIFSPQSLQLFYNNFTPFDTDHRSIGWKLGTSSNAPAAFLSPLSIGHSGFTGTSLWLEPYEKNIYILLTNRIHPEVKNVNMNSIRNSFHKLAKKKLNKIKKEVN